jgi:hypothetical protein
MFNVGPGLIFMPPAPTDAPSCGRGSTRNVRMLSTLPVVALLFEYTILGLYVYVADFAVELTWSISSSNVSEEMDIPALYVTVTPCQHTICVRAHTNGNVTLYPTGVIDQG